VIILCVYGSFSMTAVASPYRPSRFPFFFGLRRNQGRSTMLENNVKRPYGFLPMGAVLWLMRGLAGQLLSVEA
jgi:hypothetical protein